MELGLTLGAIAAAIAVGAWMIRLERRPHDITRVRLVPTTPVLFLCVLVLVLALAHLVTLATDAPFTGIGGRRGPRP
jgi:hypothetical protein